MPMKVTVCFDKLKVLVPCGDGDILVRELIEKAITRYKKAIGKSTDYWVSVHYLRTNDDSILDPDDNLSDVVDDREQLTADFEEQGGSRVPHNGDGQSVSSTGTASPDIFQTEYNNNIHSNNISNNLHNNISNKHHFRGFSLDGGNDVIVTATDITSGSGLTVRRGSEPALNVLEDSNEPLTNGNSPNKWTVQSKNQANSSKDDSHKPIIKGAPVAKEREKTPPFSRFARDSWRQSLGNQPNMFKWLEAQERQEEKIKQQPERQAPVGGSSVPVHEGESTPEISRKPAPPVKPKEVGIILCLTNDGTPLGIHVIPDFDQDGRESGLLVQGIESGGRIDQDGRLKVQDRIIEINNHDLHGVAFPKAQEIFRNAMKTEEVKLKVVKHSIPPLPKKPPPAVLPKPRGHSPVKPSPLTLPQQQHLDITSPQTSPDETSSPLDNNKKTPQSASDNKLGNQSVSQNGSRSVSPAKRAPPAPPVRSPSTTLSSVGDKGEDGGNTENNEDDNKSLSGTLTKKREALIAPTNTKKIGKRVDIDLVKGAMGLGFSVTTRDNTTGGPSPIYIKNILPKGAAVMDGRLMAGDRLLEVNSMEMTGKTQTEAVAFLRNVPLGNNVHIVVSRQEVEQDEMFKVPRELPHSNPDELDLDPLADPQPLNSFQPLDKSGDDGTLAVMRNKEILELNIPLNDTESAGLGVSVKGKTITTEEGTRDLGIFVKAVIHGGAASKDGRLFVNDQLLEVNDSSLINMPNTEAMDILRNAMQAEGPFPGHINIKIARKIGAPSPSPFSSPEGPGVEFGEGFKSGEENNNIPLDDSDHVTKAGLVSPIRAKGGGAFSDFKSPNLFLDRIMAGNGLRNESYTKATHESYAETPDPFRRKDNLIDLSKQRPRPHSTLGIGRGSPGSHSSSSEDANKEPAWIHGPDWNRHPSQTSEDSQLSPTGDGFSRDGFGRQSMSEKRKGHNDPRSSEVYQRAKGLKEVTKEPAYMFDRYDLPLRRATTFYMPGLQRGVQQSGSYGRLIRAGSADSLLSRSNSNINNSINARDARDKLNMSRNSGMQSNLKRFSSLENLTTMHDADADASVSFDDDEMSPQPRMARRRGGNESFRAAVDRSYDPVPRIDMDPQQPTEKSSRMQRSLSVEEESSEGGSLGRDPANSARSSVSDNDPQARKKEGKKGKEARRSGGRLKGLFKFGFGRKTPVDDIGKSEAGKPHNVSKDSTDSAEHNHRDHLEHHEQMWRHSQVDQDRTQENYRRLQEQYFLDQQRLRHQQQQQPPPPQAFTHFPYKPPEPHSTGMSAPVIGTRDTNRDQPALSRAEKIQQLRADHQRRHQERQGQYPHEDREEEYEKQIQEEEKKKFGQSAIPSQLEGPGPGQGQRPHSRNHHERPNSRIGSTDTAHQGSSNYQDYSDIQMGARHLSDSNVPRYPHNRAPSRGQAPDYSHQYHPHPPPLGNQRGPTPTHESRLQQHAGIARGPTPVHDQDRNSFYPQNTNYPPPHRGPTPTNENWHQGDPTRRGYNMNQSNSRYGDVNQSNVRYGDINQANVRYGDHVTRQEGVAPSSGNYSSSSSGAAAYREPVYTAMAGKRPVKSLSSQPNSAKV